MHDCNMAHFGNAIMRTPPDVNRVRKWRRDACATFHGYTPYSRNLELAGLCMHHLLPMRTCGATHWAFMTAFAIDIGNDTTVFRQVSVRDRAYGRRRRFRAG